MATGSITARLGPGLQGDRVGVHEAGRRRGDDQPGLRARVVHVDRVRGRHVVLHRLGGALVARHVLVLEQRDLVGGEVDAGDDDAHARHLARPVAEQHPVAAVPERVGRGDPAEQRQPAALVERLVGDLGLAAGGRHGAVGRRVVLGVVGRVDEHQRAALLRARERHQRRRDEAGVLARRVHVARMEEAVARALRAVEHEHVGAVGLEAEDREAVARADVLPAREHDVAVRPHHRDCARGSG